MWLGGALRVMVGTLKVSLDRIFFSKECSRVLLRHVAVSCK